MTKGARRIRAEELLRAIEPQLRGVRVPTQELLAAVDPERYRLRLPDELIRGWRWPHQRDVSTKAGQLQFHHAVVGNLELDAAEEALAIPLAASGRSFGLSLITEIVEQTAGYPYFLQFFAAFACSRIGLEHIELANYQRVESALLHELDLAFFEDRFEGAPQTEQLVLEAMARGTGPVTLRRLRPQLRDIASVDLLIRRLIERGLVYRTGRATYDFALPLFRSFIRRRRQLTRLTRTVRTGSLRAGAPDPLATRALR